MVQIQTPTNNRLMMRNPIANLVKSADSTHKTSHFIVPDPRQSVAKCSGPELGDVSLCKEVPPESEVEFRNDRIKREVLPSSREPRNCVVNMAFVMRGQDKCRVKDPVPVATARSMQFEQGRRQRITENHLDHRQKFEEFGGKLDVPLIEFSRECDIVACGVQVTRKSLHRNSVSKDFIYRLHDAAPLTYALLISPGAVTAKAHDRGYAFFGVNNDTRHGRAEAPTNTRNLITGWATATAARGFRHGQQRECGFQRYRVERHVFTDAARLTTA